MIRQIVEISKEGLYLNKDRGFLVISERSLEINRVPIKDILVLLLTASGITFTKGILTALNENGTPVIFCGKSFSPESILLPLFGNYSFSGRLSIQVGSSIPLRKQLWKTIIQEKIYNQALILKKIGDKNGTQFLKNQVGVVKSGDTTNREAVAAKFYWGKLFGSDFIRMKDSDDGINSFLNYGYAILRGMTARAVCATGLHPSIGLHHKNKLNNLCLVDDMMEPFRPLVDLFVFNLFMVEKNGLLTTNNKKQLSQISFVDVISGNKKSPLSKALEYYSFSLLQSFSQKRNLLCIPKLSTEDITSQTCPLPF